MSDDQDNRAFVMLNGSRGNFCLQVDGDPDRDPRSIAWSSDVGHFVQVGEQVIVRGWLDDAFPPTYSASDVAQRLRGFHEYLDRTEPNRDASIISHALRVLRQLRYNLPETFEPHETLDQFLVLIAAAVDDVAPKNLKQGHWSLSQEALEQSSVLRDSEWETLVKEFISIRPTTGLKPLMRLLLRHASGPLFQEVHYGIQTPLMRQLPGIAPPPVKVLSRDVGKTSGVYFTPPYIARTLVEQALYAYGPILPDQMTAFDPACGSSEFFKELIRQLALRRYGGRLEVIGWDSSHVATSISQFALGAEKDKDRPFKLSVTIQQKDSLAVAQDQWPKNVDFALLNPPFAGWNFLSAVQRDQLREILGERSRPNMAAAFLLRAMECVKEGGILASVIPASITDTQASHAVREQISSQFTPTLLAKLGNQALFTNALVDTSLYVGQRKLDPSKMSRVLWADPRPESLFKALRMLRVSSASSLESEAVDEEDFSIYPDFSIARTGAPWTARSQKSMSLLGRCTHLPRAGTLFNIKQGVRHGGDVFLQSAEFVHSLPENEQRFFRPAVVNESIHLGRLLDSIYIWYPKSEGLPLIADERELKEYVPNYFAAKLIAMKEKLCASKTRHREELAWWELLWSRPDDFAQRRPKLVSKYFGGAGSFAYDRSGRFVTVVGHSWLPKSSLADVDETAYHAYVALLASPLCEELLKSVSVHIGGGQLNLEAKYLNNLPLPSLGKSKNGERSFALIRQLAEMGQLLSSGNPLDMELLDKLAHDAYRLR